MRKVSEAIQERPRMPNPEKVQASSSQQQTFKVVRRGPGVDLDLA